MHRAIHKEKELGEENNKHQEESEQTFEGMTTVLLLHHNLVLHMYIVARLSPFQVTYE